jgi:hypothetical protein
VRPDTPALLWLVLLLCPCRRLLRLAAHCADRRGKNCCFRRLVSLLWFFWRLYPRYLSALKCARARLTEAGSIRQRHSSRTRRARLVGGVERRHVARRIPELHGTRSTDHRRSRSECSTEPDTWLLTSARCLDMSDRSRDPLPSNAQSVRRHVTGEAT